MSLLQNEEFAIYQLRTGYLANIKDGVGERLINVNTSIVNSPAFRAAGWTANPADLKRTYSPPIPTAGVSEYFRAPIRHAGLSGTSLGDDEDEGGMVTGGGSNETMAPATTIKRRRRREAALEEDDSSDLSDETDEETETTAAQQIKFAKMPVRKRTGSPSASPLKPLEGPALMVTSPSKPPESGIDGIRGGSLVDLPRGRDRRDTTTSSELSSELDVNSSVMVRGTSDVKHAARAGRVLAQIIQEDDPEALGINGLESLERDQRGAESDDSSLSSEFVGSADSDSILPIAPQPSSSSPIANMQRLRSRIPPINTSPKKPRQPPPVLQALPPARPISMVQPVSALAVAIRAKNKKPASPLERFALLSGKGDPNPLYIKIYVPFATSISKSFELLLRRNSSEGAQVTVADAIGFSLFRYTEEKLEPPIDGDRMSVNRWTLRMVEDGDVDFDFPALGRTRPIVDFTSNNNRPSRGRMRDRPWDEFALVEATKEQFEENERLTPIFSKQAATAQAQAVTDLPSPAYQPASQTGTPTTTLPPRQNPITGTNFGPAPVRKDTSNLLDTPNLTTAHATPRTGTFKALKIHFTDGEFHRTTVSTEVTTDTYIAEVFDQVCKKLNLDKALYILKVSGTNTVAPTDRTIESMGDRSDLDLIRRRFIGDGAFGISGSPGSSSPNAPLLPTPAPGTPKKLKKGVQTIHPLSSKQDLLTTTSSNTTYKRYNVIRKQPMSFTSSHQRILAIDGEYIHIMPPDTGKTLFDAATKTTTIPFSSVVGCKVSRKHPKTFRLVVFKERESKRYDFEAVNAAEANQIVEEIKKGVQPFQDLVV